MYLYDSWIETPIFGKPSDECECFKKMMFFKKMVYCLTDNTDRFTGFQPLPTDEFIGFSTDLSVIPIGKPIILILDFSNSKRFFYRFSR
jgi:hypothetical protein